MTTNYRLVLVMPQQFIDLCACHRLEPEGVVRGFIADLCCLHTADYTAHGPEVREHVHEYFDLVGGYTWWKLPLE